MHTLGDMEQQTRRIDDVGVVVVSVKTAHHYVLMLFLRHHVITGVVERYLRLK